MKNWTARYRFFLVFLLLAVIGGGIWYCYEMNEKKAAPENATLVESEEWNAADHLS